MTSPPFRKRTVRDADLVTVSRPVAAVSKRQRRSSVVAGAPITTELASSAWLIALDLAGGDHSRLREQPDGTVLVLNHSEHRTTVAPRTRRQRRS